MKHVRQQVREAFDVALRGLPTTGGNCYLMRTYPLKESRLPALLIYTPSETVNDISLGDHCQERVIGVAIEAHARGAAFDDILDRIAVEVEQAVFNDAGLKALTFETELTETRLDLSSGQDDRRGGILVMSYRVTCMVKAGNPTTVD